jgi:hypothetical protein
MGRDSPAFAAECQHRTDIPGLVNSFVTPVFAIHARRTSHRAARAPDQTASDDRDRQICSTSLQKKLMGCASSKLQVNERLDVFDSPIPQETRDPAWD